MNELKEEVLVHQGEGMYKGDYRPKPLDEIKITVEAPGFEKLEAKTVVPETPDLKIISITDEEKIIRMPDDGYEHRVVELNINSLLKDDGAKENYYYVKGRKKTFYNGLLSYTAPLEIKLSDILDNDKVIGSSDVVSGSIWEEEEDNENIRNIFTDVFINGKELALNFSFTEPQLIGKDEQPKYDVVYEIEVAQMTKDLYSILFHRIRQSATKAFPLLKPHRYTQMSPIMLAFWELTTATKYARSST